MLKVKAVCTVVYTCTLTDEDEKIVREYVKENDLDLDSAIKYLCDNDEIDVYAGHQIESDSCTEKVGLSEFNDKEDL